MFLIKIAKWIRCHVFGLHDWTTDLEKRGGKQMEGLDTDEKIKAAFINDCRMYCDFCGNESEVSKEFTEKMKKEL
jgi:hypothetical protein